jgi:uncharacterized protein (TIGR02217 family)
MAFHDITLPDAFQYGSSAGGGFATIIQQTATGHEFRVARQSQSQHRMSLRSELRNSSEAKALKAFALARRGALHSFRIKDWSDYTTNADGETAPTAIDQLIGSGTGTQTTYQLVKRYEITGPNEYIRTLTLPVSGTVLAAIDGTPTTAFTVNSTGQLVFNTAPANGTVITAGCRFDVPVRFTSDVDAWTRLQADAYNVWSLPQLDVVEVLNEVEQPERWHNGGAKFHGLLTSSIRLAWNDGALHVLGTSTAGVNVFLPVPTYQASGPALLTILHTTGTQNVQIKDDAGNNVFLLGVGGRVRLGMYRSGGVAYWVSY